MSASKAPRTPMPERDPKERIAHFEEVACGFDLRQAQAEAERCLQCRNPRCVGSCPVSIRIPEFIRHVAAGDLGAAAEVIEHDNSLASICGRVCPQESQCEGACILGLRDKSVAIGALERFVGDWRLEQGTVPRTAAGNGRRVAVVGSGPAGLACAVDLARMGYEVTLFEALHKAGGVLRYGIPEFRLPKERVLERVLERIRQQGIRIETDTIIGRTLTVDDLMDREGFDAVFIGSGAGLPRFMGIPGENLSGVFSANEFLTRANLMHAYDAQYDTPIYAGSRTVVVGGGNVAMDAVRTARRLGAEATIVYRRSAEELPARQEEVRHAREEGIGFQLLTNPVAILGNDEGWVRALRCQRMTLGDPDASGRRTPVEIPGSEFEIPCDAVIMALGTSPNPLLSATTGGLRTGRHGTIEADPEGTTSREGVFAGGDAVTGAATVILAMGAGRRAARAIDAYLRRK